MDFSRLEKNLTDNIKEAQLKLGYDDLPMSLNYMRTTLDSLVGEECTEDILAEFAEYAKPRLGDLKFGSIRDGVCITIPASGTAYVNSLTEGYEFLSELISAVSSHEMSIEKVTDIFRKYSENVVVEESGNEEFDVLVYFADKVPDEYLYCLTAEPCINGGCHIIYHRFIKEDYKNLF